MKILTIPSSIESLISQTRKFPSHSFPSILRMMNDFCWQHDGCIGASTQIVFRDGNPCYAECIQQRWAAVRIRNDPDCRRALYALRLDSGKLRVFHFSCFQVREKCWCEKRSVRAEMTAKSRSTATAREHACNHLLFIYLFGKRGEKDRRQCSSQSIAVY